MNPCLGDQRKKKKIPTTLNCCYCRIKQKTTKPQSKQEAKSATTIAHQKSPQLHKLLKQFIHKTKQQIHPQFTNKVTNFSPNLLASLKFFGRTELRGQFLLRRGKGRRRRRRRRSGLYKKEMCKPPLEIVHKPNFSFLFLTKYENLNKPNTAFTLLCVPINSPT